MTARHRQILARLRAITVGVAGCPAEAVTEDVTFLDLGFDSLSLMQLATALQDAFGVRITLRQLFDVLPSVAAVVRHIDRELPPDGEPVPDRPATADANAASAGGADRDPGAASAQPGAPRSVAPMHVERQAATVRATVPVPVPAMAGSLPPELKMVILQQLDLMSRQLDAMAGALHAAAPTTTPLPSASAAVSARPAVAPASARAPDHPLTFATTEAQQELWFTASLGPEAASALNEATAYWIEGELDGALLASVIEDVLARHEALNVRFSDDGERQRHDPAALAARIRVRHEDLSSLDADQARDAIAAQIAREAATPFDLERGPLGRVILIRLAARRHLLLTYYPHIAYDGYSGGLLMAEIAEGYEASRRGQPMPPSTARPFSAYVERLQSPATGAAIERARRYWMSQFPVLPPPLALPTRAARDARPGWDGGTVHRELGPGALETVRALARSCRTTVSTTLLAVFELLLARLGRQDEVVVGMPAAGQVHLGVPCVGYCVNTLPIRTRPIRGKAFSTLARETQQAVLDAVDHQDMGLGAILRAGRFTAANGRLPLVEVMFNFSAYQTALAIDGCRIVAHETRRAAVVHDMFLHVVESADRLYLDWDYRSALFDASTIEQWMSDYVNLIDTVAAMSVPASALPSPGQSPSAPPAGAAR